MFWHFDIIAMFFGIFLVKKSNIQHGISHCYGLFHGKEPETLISSSFKKQKHSRPHFITANFFCTLFKKFMAAVRFFDCASHRNKLLKNALSFVRSASFAQVDKHCLHQNNATYSSHCFRFRQLAFQKCSLFGLIFSIPENLKTLIIQSHF